MEEKKGSKKKKGTGKKIVVGFLGVGMIVGLTIVGTLAFLNATSDQKTNTFTASEDILLELDEPSYNRDENGELVDSNLPDPKDYQPDTTYAKDPTLYNLTGTKGTSPEWVAMRVDYGLEGMDGKLTNVTREQLTHKCTEDDCANKDSNGNITNWNKCTGLNYKGGVLEEFIDEDKLGDGWFQLSSAQIAALTEDTTDSESSIKYEIYVYKYKLIDALLDGKDNKGNDIEKLADAQEEEDDNFLSVANGTSDAVTNDGKKAGGKTNALFKSVTVQTKDQLKTNRYLTDGLLDAPKFEIIVRGGAAKHDSSVENLTSINENVFVLTEGAFASDNKKTDSYKVVADLVKLLSAKTPTFSDSSN